MPSRLRASLAACALVAGCSGSLPGRTLPADPAPAAEEPAGPAEGEEGGEAPEGPSSAEPAAQAPLADEPSAAEPSAGEGSPRVAPAAEPGVADAAASGRTQEGGAPGPGEGPGAGDAPGDPAPAPDSLSWAETTLAALTLEEKAAQMVMPFVFGDFTPEGSARHERELGYLERGVGGVLLSVGSPTSAAVKLNDLQVHSRLPLLVASDLETGAGFRLRGAIHLPSEIELGGATDFPSLMAVGAAGDPELAYDMGRVTAVEARAVGIHVPFAPVLDVNSDPDNPIINVRSLGEDPWRVADLGAAFVLGAQDYGALATAKHFPGHGDTDVDSHRTLPVIRSGRARLDSVELVPFRRAVDEGVAGVMTAHIVVPALNGGNGDPATLSRRVLGGLLREEMGFRGLVYTDAMDMGAIDRRWDRGEAAVRAVEAGADVLVQPPSVEAAVEGIVDAVCSGRLPEERVDSSVLRILSTKEGLGLHRMRTVSLDELPRRVGIPAHEDVARAVAERSLTLLRNGGGLLPLLGTRSARVLSVTYRRDRDLLAGRYFEGRLRATYPRLVSSRVGRDTPAAVYEGLLREARSSQLVVVSFYVTAVSYAGSVAVPDEVVDFVRRLDGLGVPHVVVSFGNPYLLKDFPDVQAYLLAWSGAEVSQRAAAAALFGRIPITGRVPTGAPPHFRLGDGIVLPARGGR